MTNSKQIVDLTEAELDQANGGSIIGILIPLLLPSVQTAREASAPSTGGVNALLADGSVRGVQGDGSVRPIKTSS